MKNNFFDDGSPEDLRDAAPGLFVYARPVNRDAFEIRAKIWFEISLLPTIFETDGEIEPISAAEFQAAMHLDRLPTLAECVAFSFQWGRAVLDRWGPALEIAQQLGKD